ncbi:MAG: hypothetical protein WCL22_04760 [bacterium]
METKSEVIEQRDIALAALTAILESIDDESISESETVDRVEGPATKALDEILGSDSDDEDEDENKDEDEDEDALTDA